MYGLATLISEAATERAWRKSTAYQMNRTVEILSDWLQRPATTGALGDAVVSDWLQHLQTCYASRTVATHRANLMTVWRYAADRGLCGWPGRIRRCRRPTPDPRAWTLEEVRRLVEAARESPGGRRNGRRVAWSDWLPTLLLVTYETGLRRTDVLEMHRGDVDDCGRVRVRMRKTGRVAYRMLSEQTAARLRELPGDRPLAIDGKTLDRQLRRLCERACVASGGLQRLRRTGATYCYRTGGIEAARAYLCHETETCWRNYVDRSIGDRCPVMPPRVA